MGVSSSKGKAIGTDKDPKEIVLKFVMQGLPSSGKTSLLYRLKHGELLDSPINMIGVDFQILRRDGLKMRAFDATGRGSRRVMFRTYSRVAEAFIYMIDSVDSEDQINESLGELNDTILFNEETKNLVVMVLANKQDLENAVSVEEIERKINEQCNINKGISLFVMPCSVFTGEGIQEAYDLFVKMIKMKRGGKLRNGLIPNALELANEVTEENNTNTDDVIQDISPKVFEKNKKSVFKDPVHLLKSILFH